jgi:opacity protein-like surface antigen
LVFRFHIFKGLIMFKKITIAAALAVVVSSSFAADKPAIYVGADVGSSKIDGFSGRSSSFGGFLGYQFNDHFAVESGYRRFAKGTMFGADLTFNQTALSLVASMPVAPQFNIFGRIGYNRLSVDASVGASNGTASDTGTMVGFGLSYDIAPNISARLEFQRPSSDSTNVGVGVAFKF